jgi:hypothetical protein
MFSWYSVTAVPGWTVWVKNISTKGPLTAEPLTAEPSTSLRFGRDDKGESDAAIWGRLPRAMQIQRLKTKEPQMNAGTSHPPALHAHTLEHELQRELNEPRIPQLATRNSETRIIGTTTGRIRWPKLDAIKRIEELRPELNTELFTRTEARRLEYREVPVIDPFAPKVRIHTRLVPETKVRGSGEASRVEPCNSPRLRHVRGTLGASPHNIGAQGTNSQTRLG